MRDTGKCTFVITEKPDAAEKIACALDVQGTPRRLLESGVPYYRARRDGDIIVVPALGHLYTVGEEKSRRRSYPVFEFKWQPRYAVERNAARNRVWLKAISKLAEDADSFVDACDYDVEGSIVGYNVLMFACGNKDKDARRMKYSTLTKEELEKSYGELLPHLDFGLIEAGLTRHEVDWLYGINLSRALTSAAKNQSKRYTILSTGRVQGPTLRFIAARERTINSFVPTPYWRIEAYIELKGRVFEASHEKARIETKAEAESRIKACQGKNGEIREVNIERFEQRPPPPFDLGSLQGEAYRQFGYSPKRTASLAQRLYLDALISYPRTASQKLPPTINYEAILKKLSASADYRGLINELIGKPVLRPREGKKEDSAHVAIYPTGKLLAGAFDVPERRIWDLIVRRFLAVFGEPAVREKVRISIDVNGERFFLNEIRTLEKGWLRFYEGYAKMKERFLSSVENGDAVRVKKIVLDNMFTQPPRRYDDRSLLRRMEKEGIGTKATRGDVIQTLFDRKYVKGRPMVMTDIGFEVLNVLKEHCSTIVSVEFTRELEQRMNNIQNNLETRERVLADSIEKLKPVMERFRDKEKTIGEKLTGVITKSRMQERIVGKCPTCKTGELMIMRSRTTRKRFIGCSNYFKGLCKTSFPLPQKGSVSPRTKTCRGCGWPTVQVRISRGRPWVLCFNPECRLKKERKKSDVQSV